VSLAAGIEAALVELTFFGADDLIVELALAPGLVVRVDAAADALTLTRDGAARGAWALSDGPAGYATDGFNMLRVLLDADDDDAADGGGGQRVSVFFNPTLKDVMPDGVPPPGAADARIVAMPPRIIVALRGAAVALDNVTFSAVAGNETKLDYLSVLPPTLYGEDYSP
jgi:hypothetical protein